MSAFTQDIGQDPWSEFSGYPVWRSRAWPNARVLFCRCQIMRVVPPSNYLRGCSLEPDPVNINLPILFKRVALGSSFMGITGRYIFRYFLTVYFTRMLGVSPFTGDGVMAFIDKIVMLRSRAAQNYFFQLGDQVFWD
ncbi:hypothetical protein CFIMG_004155RA [Ceratocystis fimbriata CBS 114723]|uniref:Uncharacterized protein n=1 Tax=Ceratocystis fimbriata CBS 114723 TaxID=1035309 RepID=A0A2C5X1H7_9PEZI|nr:hypothetical protein CFIMG_004155RA [Ceratocystis fimbriata CBS 114723]